MMSELTPKQEAFCLAYLETGNASEAYRRAYSAGGMAPATINRKAKELLDNGKVTARVAELRQPAVEAAQVTYEGHLRRLEELSWKAEAAGQMSAAISAEVARGKAAGLYTDRVDHTSMGSSLAQMPRIIELVTPDLVADLAARLVD